MGLTVSRQLKIFFSSLFIQASWSFAGLQSLGFIYTLITSGKKIRIKRHFDCFNTHPYMAGFVIGAVLGIEESKKHLLAEHLRRSKAALQSAFASVGDLFFWNLLRPALGIISVVLTLKFGIIGPIFFLISYNAIHIYARFVGIAEGYKKKANVIDDLKSPVLWKSMTGLEIIGIFATGLLFGVFLPAGNLNLTILLVVISGISILWIIKQKPISILLTIILAIMIIEGVI